MGEKLKAAGFKVVEPSGKGFVIGTGNVPTAKFSLRQRVLRDLVVQGTVRMRWAPEVMESAAPCRGRKVSPDRIRGMLLGLAIGDALGNHTESMLPANRTAHYGEIRDYLPNKYAGGRRVGLPSDDTQLAFWTLRNLVDHGSIEPDALAELFCSHHIFGIGHATREFVREWKRTGDWHKAAQPSAGNGGLMRIAPVLLPYLGQGGVDLWVDAVLGTAVTHNDPAAIASSVAFVGLLADLVTMDRPPPREWWISRFVELARPIEGDETEYAPRGGPLAGKWTGPLWRLVEEQLPSSLDKPTIEAAETWYSGAYLLETVPTVLHLLARHAADPEEAIVRAINDTKDNDTIAAIVGAAVGALHGESALPLEMA